jgi:hypothetical protein
MKTRLTERDLNRIVRRVVREGVIVPNTKYTSDNGDNFQLSCKKSLSFGGTLDPEKEYQNNPYLQRGEKILTLTGEFEKFFCSSN